MESTSASFVSAGLVGLIEAASVESGHAVRFAGAVMMADVSGFTALTERITAMHGQEGAATLTAILNRGFEPMLRCVTEAGGDVARFAGDALLAWWPELPETPGQAKARALACGAALIKAVEGLQFEAAADVSLSVRVAVAGGDLAALRLGGFGDRCEAVLAGSGFSGLAETLKRCETGQVLATEDVAGQPEEGTASRALPARRAATKDAHIEYLPPVVRRRLEAGAEAWLGELRTLTALFCALPGLDLSDDADVLRLNKAVRQIQEALGHAARVCVGGPYGLRARDGTGVLRCGGRGVPTRLFDHGLASQYGGALDAARRGHDSVRQPNPRRVQRRDHVRGGRPGSTEGV